MKLVTDASLIIAIFDKEELGNPSIWDKIPELGFEIIIPPSVYKEVSSYQKEGLKIENIDKPFVKEEWFKIQTRYTNLGEGENQVITYGLYCKGIGEEYLCLLDDKKARKIALDLDLLIIGTLGLMDRLFQAKQITEKEYVAILEKLKKSKFRILTKEIDDRIKKLDSYD